MHYGRFFAMIATSSVVMFGLMYLNTYLPSHVFFSETRAYMTFVMGAAMAIVMLAFMLSMYTNRTLNIAIFAGSAVVFAGALWLVRSQATVEDTSYMRAMIPHHSIAIMTSGRANLSDARVRRLADGIIYAQDKEIAEMRYLIADIEANGKTALRVPGSEPAELKDAGEALATEVVARIDPEFISSEEIRQVFPQGATCRFTYTEDSPAVLVTGEDAEGPAALIKISGDLVRLSSDAAGTDGGRFVADPLSAEVRPTDDDDLHDLVVTAGAEYEAGFRGQYACGS